jgi:hypothetical protein
MQTAFNKAAEECIKHVASTSVKVEIKLVIDKDEKSIIKILCSIDTKLPAETVHDQGQIVDDTVCTQMPVENDLFAELLDFTGEKETKLRLSK